MLAGSASFYQQMKIKTLHFNPLRECCHIVWSEPSRECVILDPGCYDRGEFSRLERFVTEENLHPAGILLTHGHFDHIFGLSWAREKWDVPVMMHPDDSYQIRISGMFAAALELDFTPYTGDFKNIAEGDTVTFGTDSLTVLHTPGHTAGCVCFYSEPEKLLFSGDTLFQGSVGRTDHPKGDFQTLLQSIDRLAQLPDDTRIYPGHGYPTTIADERRTNPFFPENRQRR